MRSRHKSLSLALATLVAAVTLFVSQPARATNPVNGALEGSWTETDSRDNSTFISLLTFTVELTGPRWHGEATGTYVNRVVALQTSGHGAWIKTGEGQYTIVLRFLDPTGTYVRAEVHKVIQVDDALDHYIGTFLTKILDANGNVLETLTGTVDGKRIHV